MSDANISYLIQVRNAAALGALRQTIGAVHGLRDAVSGAFDRARSMAFFGGMAAGATAVAASVYGIKRAIDEAATAETRFTTMKVLLKDAEAARAAITEAVAFSDVTPFEPGAVVDATKGLIGANFQLREMRGLLEDAGDLAAASNVDLGETVRLFARLNSGDFGQAFARLRDFAISREALEGAGLKFDASGSFVGSAKEAMDGVRRVIRERFGGTMAEVSQTFGGLVSTLKGRISGAFAGFGEPLVDFLKTLLTEASRDFCGADGWPLSRTKPLAPLEQLAQVLMMSNEFQFID
jgi:hypothetical protein